MAYDYDNTDADQRPYGEAVEYLLPRKRNRVRPSKVLLSPGTYSVREVAAMLGLSSKTVIRKFRNIAGVLNHGTKKAGRKQSRSRLTIPKKVFEKYLTDHAVE
jgi:hypothetical protein